MAQAEHGRVQVSSGLLRAMTQNGLQGVSPWNDLACDFDMY